MSLKNPPKKVAREFKIFHMNDSKEYKIVKDCIFCSQLRENHKITNMSYQKASVDDLESSTRPNRNPPNTPEKSQLKKWLGIAGAIALLIVIATAIGYTVHIYQNGMYENSFSQFDRKSKSNRN